MNKEIVDYLNFVESEFINCFNNKGYFIETPVQITSGVDPTVTLVGSSISVLKPYFLERRILPGGVSLMQKSMRTRNIKNLRKPVDFRWGSFFTNLGCLVNYNSLAKITQDLMDYLTVNLMIPEENIMIRCNTNDVDLCYAIKQISQNVNIECNSMPPEYYKHKYGLENLGIYGRNFNVALKDKVDGEFKDIGNIIVIESENEKFGVEFGIGSASIVMCEYGLSSAIKASRLADFYDMESIPKLHFADSLLGVSNLMYEDAKRIKEPRYLRSIYSKYQKSLYFWMYELGYDKEFVKELMEVYLEAEYNRKYKIDKQIEAKYLSERDDEGQL